MELKSWTRPNWDFNKTQPFEDILLTLTLKKDGKVVKELSIESTQTLKNAISRVTQRQLASLTIVLSVILFSVGMFLVGIAIWSK